MSKPSEAYLNYLLRELEKDTGDYPMAKHNGEKRQHKATYSRDKRNGGYLVRVEGPHANRFAGRDVPVTRKDGSEGDESLDQLVWAGRDKDTSNPVALYTFIAKPKEELDDLPF